MMIFQLGSQMLAVDYSVSVSLIEDDGNVDDGNGVGNDDKEHHPDSACNGALTLKLVLPANLLRRLMPS